MKLSFAILSLLAAESHGFSIAPAKPTSSSSLNMAFGAGEAIAITALSGVVSKMTKKREELYAAGNMGAVQSEAEAASPVSGDGSDISIPYDAPALLAYTSAGSKGDFETFKAEYLKDTIAMVVAKKLAREGGAPVPVPAAVETAPVEVDISIPYDAPALLAYTAAGSKGDFETFKDEYLKEAIAMVVAKKVAREGGAPAPAAVASTPEVVDISIPYDAPALLAYTAAGSKGDFETFKAEYLKDAIAMVVAKKVAREGGAPAPAAVASTPEVVDISIPYDAPALLAYTAAGSKGDFETFKAEYLKEAIAMVVAKKVAREGGTPAPVPAAVETAPVEVDISIPYDAPVLLAYTASGSKGDFETFKAEYLKDTIAMVVAKKVAREGGTPAPAAVASTPEVVDISIPYDAPALLAYTAAGSKGDFETFKAEYLKNTIAMVKAKRAAVLAN